MKIEKGAVPKYHSYSLPVIQTAIALVMQVGVSFRAVSKVFVAFNLYFQINLGTPSHTTVLNWTKKQGLSNIRNKEFFNEGKWVLIMDESIQFGNKKLLLVLAFPEEIIQKKQALTYSDLTPLVLQVGESWKSADIAALIKESIDFQQISYVISDAGSNLKGAIKLLGCEHIEDVNHKFSLIIRDVFEENETFKYYVKELAGMRAKLSMSKMARIVPPNQRIISRFMNLTPLFRWGVKMIKLMDSNLLSAEEMEKLSFLKSCRAFVFETNYILSVLEKIQTMLKNNGFNRKIAESALACFDLTGISNMQIIKTKVLSYFEGMLEKAGNKTIYCSSDIIESCFGKYKEIVKHNKSVGISDLCLCIAAILGERDLTATKHAMESVKIKKIRDWRKEKISPSLFAQKRELMKKLG